jgi:hypothetical protein
VVTDIEPVLPEPTTTVTVVGDSTLNELTAVPPNVTEVTPDKFVPVIVIVSPLAADVGVNELIVGGGKKINPSLPASPPPVVILKTPLLPDPTTIIMLVDDSVLKELTAVPPSVTDVTPDRLVPVTVTVAPTAALAGEKDVIVGCAKTWSEQNNSTGINT